MMPVLAELDDLVMLIEIDAVLGRRDMLRRRLKEALERAYRQGMLKASKNPRTPTN